jgi:hypothetical protein
MTAIRENAVDCLPALVCGHGQNPSLSTSASCSCDLADRDKLCIFAKSVWFLVVGIIVFGTNPTQPPAVGGPSVGLYNMSSCRACAGAAFNLTRCTVGASGSNELLVQVVDLVAVIAGSGDVLYDGAVVVVWGG